MFEFMANKHILDLEVCPKEGSSAAHLGILLTSKQPNLQSDIQKSGADFTPEVLIYTNQTNQ